MAAALLTPSARRPRGCSSDGISAAAASPDLQPSLNMEVRSGPPGGVFWDITWGRGGPGPREIYAVLCCARGQGHGSRAPQAALPAGGEDVSPGGVRRPRDAAGRAAR
ncbi:hypothetical protein B2J93_6391 [Marssonina coronariae]|uniref:Uncharacterized protein n=1 Tax=Diplocarpon coronariae TaxID=2795749 RepID=A0A218Z5U2_9HELO|nr:hypothetical protein B2J93_6391 [Marssonina coronariae]